MKVIMVLVTSVDGKITHGDNPDISSWTSKEDQEHFYSLMDRAGLIVMGSKTYEAAKGRMKLDKKRLRVVMTRDAARFQGESFTDCLEFTEASPSQLIDIYEKRGFKELMLVG